MSDCQDVAYWERLSERNRQGFIRWNGYTMAQFTVVIALLSTLSVSALGAGIALLQRPPVSQVGAHSLSFAIGMLLFILTILLALLATISRTLDFRMTARKVRGRTDCRMFGCDDKQLGQISWFLFWSGTAAFMVGAFLFVASVYSAFALQLMDCK